MSNQILVVDDEVSILTLLKFNLTQAGFSVVAVENGEDALHLAQKEQFGLIVLDLMLPKMDGIEVCKRLRMENNQTPILMLTAKDDEFDKVLGLELGADDYMTKPFSPREVVARVKAILRRAQTAEAPKEKEFESYEIADLKVIPERYEAIYQNQLLELTPKEFELLVYLVKNKGRVLTRDQLLNAVWNYEFMGDTRIVDVHISHLREKIEQDTRRPSYIKTIRGLGYKLEEPRVNE